MPPRVADILTPLPIGQSVWFGPSCEWTDMPSCACRLPLNTVSGRLVCGVVCSVGSFFQMSLWFSIDVHSLFLQESEPPAVQGAVAERVGPGVVSGLRSLWEGVGWGGLAP